MKWYFTASIKIISRIPKAIIITQSDAPNGTVLNKFCKNGTYNAARSAIMPTTHATIKNLLEKRFISQMFLRKERQEKI